MNLTVEIESVDRSDDIEQATLQYQATLSKAPATFAFSMVKGDKTIPSLGDAIVLKEDGDALFSGTITEKKDMIRGGILIGYQFGCMDGLYELDRQLVIKAYNDTTAVAVVQDIIDTFTSGFTLDAPAESPTVETVRFNYEEPSRAITKLASQIGWDWYVDPDSVVHFFPAESNEPVLEVTDSNDKAIFNSLEFDKNLIELKNAVYVRGGEYLDPISEANAIDKKEADGEERTFYQGLRYSNVEVTVDGNAQTVGTEFIHDPADYDCLYNYQEKYVVFPEASKPSAAEVVKVFGDAHVPLVVLAEDFDSIDTYGRREAVKVNKTLDSVEEAELLAFSLIEQWRDGSWEGSFKTRETGLRVGDMITINSTLLGVNEDYKINEILGTMNGKDEFVYKITFIKSGQTTLTDMLIDLIGKDRENVVIAPEEVLQKYRNIEDIFTITDEITGVTSDSGPYQWAPGTNEFAWNFGTWT